MAYTPTEWATGDVITAEKLNKIEQALYELSGGGGDEPPAGYVTVAPKQSVTITSDTTDAVDLEVVEGYEYPESIPTNLKVFLNDTEASFSVEAEDYFAEINSNYAILYYWEKAPAYAFIMEDDNGYPVPGTYTVAIYEPEGK